MHNNGMHNYLPFCPPSFLLTVQGVDLHMDHYHKIVCIFHSESLVTRSISHAVLCNVV